MYAGPCTTFLEAVSFQEGCTAIHIGTVLEISQKVDTDLFEERNN
jgi:hypothetical protein